MGFGASLASTGLAIINMYLSIARPLGRFDLSASAKPQRKA